MKLTPIIVKPITNCRLSGGPDDEEWFIDESESVSTTSATTNEKSPKSFPKFVRHRVVEDRIDCTEKKVFKIFFETHLKVHLTKVCRIQSIPLNQNKFENKSGAKIHRVL
jgi:hypothetical protein